MAVASMEDREKNEINLLLENIDDEIEVIIEDHNKLIGLSAEELEEIFSEEFDLEEIPSLQDHEENKTPPQTTTTEVEPEAPVTKKHKTKSPPKFVCDKCKLKYVRQSAYEKHLSKCLSEGVLVIEKELLSNVLMEEYNKEGPTMLTKSFEMVKGNKVFMIQRESRETLGNKALKLATTILTKKETTDFKDFASMLSKFCIGLLQLKTNKAAARETISTTLHRTCKNESFKNAMSKLAVNVDEEVSLFLLNNIFKSFFQLSLTWRNDKLLTRNFNEIDVKLSSQEQKTLRYVAGFIPFSLSKRFKNRQDTDMGKVVVETIETWRANPNENKKSFLEFSKSWTERVNRGGLFQVNDDFYIFIRRVENMARTVLNSNLILNYKGEDLREVLLEKLNQNELVDLGWIALTKSIQCDGMKKALKNIILRKWVSLRAKSFLNCWIRMLKRKKQNISEKSEPSMRKSLHGKGKSGDKSEQDKAESNK
ncbi:uncharacterized protein [Clytia hemisphaerica]|uniref:uncharacterized protein n=1 Tax=Clytia hemisphaerica TaxID=252671 RepID=UPI0034D58F5A